MKAEQRGTLKIGQQIYALRYGKCWWGIGSSTEYKVYKGTVRRKPKCDKSIVLVDFGREEKKLIGTVPMEISELFETPEEAVREEMKRITIVRQDLNYRELSLMRAALDAEKLREQGSLELNEPEEPEVKEQPKEENEE